MKAAIENAAEAHRLRTRLDPDDGTKIIPGRLGHIYEHDEGVLGVMVMPNPPRIMAGMGKAHATNTGIREHGEFSVNIPSVEMVAATDWCGLNSASRGAEKAAVFDIVRGTLPHAPMIADCPLSLECHVVQVVDLGTHELFVADIVTTWADEGCLDKKGRPDITKVRPFTLTMPDNRYWAVGEQVGDAWSIGKTFVPRSLR